MDGSRKRRSTFSRGFALVLAAALSSAASAQSGSADASAAALAKARDERLLLLAAAEFDPLAEAPTLPEGFTWSAGDVAGLDYFVVQLRSKVRPSDRRELFALGAQELGYLRHNAFIVRAPLPALQRLFSWARTRSIVHFEPAYRVAPSLLERAAAAGRAPIDVAISLFPGADAPQAAFRMLELGVVVTKSEPGERPRFLATMPADRLAELARIRDVQWIRPASVPVQRNGTTAWVIQSNTTDETPVWDAGVFGANVIVGHIDGAIDIDSCWFEDPAVSSPGPTHRKVVSHHGSRANPDLHGTHTAATAAGDQEPINGVIDDNGMAYHARIAHTNLSLIDSSNLYNKLDQLHDDGATIFTNSWGNDATTDYDEWCVDIDDFSWDNPDSLVCFAVTNLSTLKNPENAKNVLAVGATQQAPNQEDHCTGGDGPTADGRRKPEIYAPGCDIASARENRACDTALLSGTSMACPAITGAAALVKEYFEAGFWPSGVASAADAFVPSGALLKAVLLDASVNMTGVSGYPSDTEGWGRLNLGRGLFFSGDPRALWVADVAQAGGFGAAGESQTHFVNVLGNGVQLDVCLCFMDEAGSLNSSQPVVNDLDLEVLAPDGSLYLGNVFSGGASTTGGSADPLNNVERVKLNSPALGWYAITVRATDVASAANQGYALAATGDVDLPVEGGFEAYGAGTPGSGGFVPQLSGSGSPTIGDDVTLDVTNGLGGATGLVLLGFARWNAPFAGGELLVLPPWITIPFTLGGAAGVAGAGSFSLTGTVPADPSIVGAVVDFQAVVLDAAAAKGLALTNGLEMTIGS